MIIFKTKEVVFMLLEKELKSRLAQNSMIGLKTTDPLNHIIYLDMSFNEFIDFLNCYLFNEQTV